MMNGKICAVVLAGGKGSRMHSNIRKQYMTLAGKPLLAYSLMAFEKSDVDEIVVVAGSGEEEYIWNEIIRPYGITKAVKVTEGGQERYHSVYEGLKVCSGCDMVLIHDGARPLVTEEIIARTIEYTRINEACVVGMPVKDTIKSADDETFAAETLERSRLWQIQTPQAFSYPLIRRAYDALMADEFAQQGITDDAMVVERMTDRRVKLVEGSYQNMKVTTPEDMVVAEAFLQADKTL